MISLYERNKFEHVGFPELGDIYTITSDLNKYTDMLSEDTVFAAVFGQLDIESIKKKLKILNPVKIHNYLQQNEKATKDFFNEAGFQPMYSNGGSGFATVAGSAYAPVDW